MKQSMTNQGIASGLGMGIIIGLSLSQVGIVGLISAIILAVVAILVAFYFKSKN